MSDLVAAMEAGAGSAYVGEHSYRRVMAGDVESVRARLVYALERFDYRVLSEQPPLQAKRAARKNMVSADFLDISRRLVVGLRPNSETSTLLTFDFTVVHAGIMTRGDKRTLELEADAIVALADARPVEGVCAACGTENTAAAQFCRLCGAPSVVGVPAEVEVMRLTAGARAAHQEVIFGILIVFAALAIFLPMILLGSAKAASAGLVLLLIGQLIGWLMLLYGVGRLHRTLNPKEVKQLTPSGVVVARAQMPAVKSSALPPASITSVTEGTTELLAAGARERVHVHTRHQGGDTDPMN